MKKTFITLFGVAALVPAWSQDAASARLAYQDRQALAEVPRLVQQFDVLVENQEQIAARLVKVEAGSGDAAELHAEIDKLRGEIAELRAAVRRDQDAMRREIVDDLTRRLTGITQQMQQSQAQALAQIQARAEAALNAADAAARAAREQAEYSKRVASRPPAPLPRSPPRLRTARTTSTSWSPSRRCPSLRRATIRPLRKSRQQIPASMKTGSAWGRN